MLNLYSRFIASFALPFVSVFTASRFYELYRSYRRNPEAEVFSPSPEIILDRLRVLVDHARTSVPFYQERMKAGLTDAGIRHLDEFRHIPPVTKEDISTNFPDRITTVNQNFRPWRYRSTSGTIERLTVVHDSKKRDVARALAMLSTYSTGKYQPGMKYLEIPPDICRNVCGAAGSIEPSVFRFLLDNLRRRQLFDPEVVSDLKGLVERQLVYRTLVLNSYGSAGIAQPLSFFQAYLDQIRDYQPHLVKALPVYLYALALHILENRVTPPPIPGGILPMGSSISPYMKRIVENAFQTRVHEDYGCAELGAIGSECGHQQGIHPYSALFHVEVVKNERPAKEGEVGKVLITDLSNYAMPFIRYEIGDVAVLRNGRCPCGVAGPRLELQGRLQDCLEASDGSVVTSDEVTDAILSCPGVRLFQLEARTAKDFDLQIVCAPDKRPEITVIQKRLSALLGQSPGLSYRFVSTIAPEQGGKFRLVKSHIQVNL